MPAIVETRDLTRRYGTTLALDHLNLEIPPGAIFGFIGPNGAGKTTTMRILTTLLAPTSGEAWVAGHSVLKDPLGVAGPYMLDAGISSTFHIARFFGLVTAGVRRPAEYSGAEQPASSREQAAPASATGGAVGKIIQDALRRAGLMR